MDLWIIRILLFAATVVSGYFVRPFHLNTPFTLALSAGLGLVIILIELRVRQLTATDRSGMTLMGDAFDGDPPNLTLNDRSDPSDIDEQRGFALIYKGAIQGIRNPKAHAPFEELEERRALDYLGLSSLLMRRLDDAEERLS